MTRVERICEDLYRKTIVPLEHLGQLDKPLFIRLMSEFMTAECANEFNNFNQRIKRNDIYTLLQPRLVSFVNQKAGCIFREDLAAVD
jgi:hypothetical protein